MFWKHPPPGGGGYGKIYTVIHIRYSNYRPFRLKPVTRCRMLCCVQVTAIVKSWRRCRFYLVIDRWITSAQHVQGFICMYWKYKILFRGGKYSIALSLWDCKDLFVYCLWWGLIFDVYVVGARRLIIVALTAQNIPSLHKSSLHLVFG